MPILGKYDLVISFASEDDALARKLNRLCRKRCLRTYYYKRENNSGSQLDKLTQVIYNEKANNALVLLSNYYQNKALTQKELQWLKQAQRERKLKKIFYIPLNQELAPHYTGNTIYIPRNTPKRMAQQIVEVINREAPMSACWITIFPLLVFLITALVLAWMYYNSILQP